MTPWKVALFWLAACAAAMGQTLSSSISLDAGGYFGEVEANASASYGGYCVGVDGEGSQIYGTISIVVPDGTICNSDDEEQPTLSCGTSEFLSPGQYTVRASYSGFSGTYGNQPCSVSASSASQTVTVPYGSTMTQIYNLPASSLQIGQTFALQLLVTYDDVSGTFDYPGMTGNVDLDDGSQVLTSFSLGTPTYYDGLTYTPTFSASTKGLSTGTYTLYAEYPGDSNYASSQTSPFTVTLLPAQMATTTALKVSPNPTIEGGTTTFAVTVNPNGVTVPSGKVTLLAGSTTVGTITLNNGTGSISFSADIAPGKYSVQAVYSGDTYNIASTSSAVSVAVDAQSSTTTAVTFSPSTIVAGASTLMSVAVTPAISNVTPTGTVTVTANGTAVAALTLSNGKASEELSTAGLTPGSYSIVGKYSGSSLATASTSPTVNITISPASTVTVTASPNPVAKGSVTTLTATVKNGSGGLVTSGTVTFNYGSNALGTANVGSNGQATLPIGTSSFADGTYTITAKFGGSGSVPAATGTVSLAVN